MIIKILYSYYVSTRSLVFNMLKKKHIYYYITIF